MAETYIGGFHAVIAALEDGERKPREILLSDTRKDQRAQRMLEIAAKAKVTVRNVGRDTLDLYAPGLKHQGVLAAIEAAGVVGEDVLDVPATADRMILALDGVQDPHNLGACLRTAEAVGVSAIIIPKDRAVGLTPAVRKAAAPAPPSACRWSPSPTSPAPWKSSRDSATGSPGWRGKRKTRSTTSTSPVRWCW